MEFEYRAYIMNNDDSKQCNHFPYPFDRVKEKWKTVANMEMNDCQFKYLHVYNTEDII